MKIAICIPTYDGKICRETLLSMDSDATTLRARGDDVRYHIAAGGSFIPAVRRDLVKLAADSGADRIVLVDADVGWEAGGLIKLIEHNVEFCGAAYMQKTPGKRTWNLWFDERKRPKIDPATGLLWVDYVAIGLAVLKTETLKKVRDRVGNWHLFDMIGHLAEDTSFCKRWRDAGFDIWCDPNIETTHVAAPGHTYTGRYVEELARIEQARITLPPHLRRQP